MDNRSPFIDAHTHQIKAGSQITLLNILVGPSFTEYRNLATIHNQYPQVRFSVGIHPWYMDEWQRYVDLLEEIALTPQVIAIGECGLDKNAKAPLSEQMELFRKHIDLSETLQKPLIIHCVKFFNEILENRKTSQSKMSWIIHGFNSSPEIARKCIDSGIILSFGQSLFRPESNNHKTIKWLDKTTFFLETDESEHSIEEVYQQCANFIGVDIESLKSDLAKNFYHTFKI